MSRRPARIRLLPLLPELPPPPGVAALASRLSARLGVPVVVDPPLPFDPAWLTPDGSQLSSNRILDALIDRDPAAQGARGSDWMVALTAADLRGGGRDFVMGEATVGGCWCVVSSARLGAEGLPAWQNRLCSEILHELGHLAGLPHCDRPGCLMHPARDVADVDLRADVLCERCRDAAGAHSVLDPDFSSR